MSTESFFVVEVVGELIFIVKPFWASGDGGGRGTTTDKIKMNKKYLCVHFLCMTKLPSIDDDDEKTGWGIF
jgi:hypothetical protein